MGWVRARIKVPAELTDSQRQRLGELIIDRIRERTESGKDVNGNRFAPYSQSYVNSEAFKAAGKSPGKVNLRLSGDMMNELQVLAHETGSILVGLPRGSEENKRAEGVSELRPFVGIGQKELSQLIAEVSDGE